MKPCFTRTPANSTNFVPSAPLLKAGGIVIIVATSAQTKGTDYHCAPKTCIPEGSTLAALTTFQVQGGNPLNGEWYPPAGQIDIRIGIASSYDGLQVPEDFVCLYNLKAEVR